MSRLGAQKEEAAMLLRPPSNCEIIFDRHIFDYILYELQRYPASEEGGKYVGYIEVAKQSRSKDRCNCCKIPVRSIRILDRCWTRRRRLRR